MPQVTLNINSEVILKIFFVVIALYVLYVIKDVIIWFIFALMIAILFNFVIDSLARKRIPRIISATFLYFGMFALIGFFIYKSAPVILGEIQEFSNNLPVYLKKVSPIFEKLGFDNLKNSETLLKTVQGELQKVGGNFGAAIASIFGGASVTAMVVALAYFISLEKNFIERIIAAFAPSSYHEYLFSLWRRSKKKVSGWFVARMLGALFVGSFTFLVLRILNVKYSFLIALFSGILDFLPFIGPLVMGVVMFAVVALNSFFQAVFVVVAFLIIQQLENHLLFPVLFRRFIGISPVLVLVAFAIGGELWGFAGAILSIPLAGVIYEILKDYLAKKRIEQKVESLPPKEQNADA